MGLSCCVSAAVVLLLQAPVAAGPEADLHFERALQYEFQGNTNGAEAEFRKVLELEPGSAEGHSRLGVLLLEYRGDVDGAISELVTAVTIDPDCRHCQSRLDDAVSRRNGTAAENIVRGNELYRVGQLSRSIGAFQLAIFLEPENAEARNSLAWTLYRMGQLNEALSEVKEALRLKPNEPEYINTLACVQYDKGNLEASISNWTKAIALSKTANPADLYGLAIGFLSRGDKQKAVESFNQALKVDPSYADAKYLRDRIGMSVHALASHEALLSLSGHKEEPSKSE